jgi:DNA sulfur modification protein DndB
MAASVADPTTVLERLPVSTTRRSAYEHVFPAIRAIQAQRHYYVTMFPLRLVPRLFLFDEEELQPSLRAQRTLNKARVPEIARYMLDNPTGYVFSALTASVDADLQFTPVGQGGPEECIGTLTIPMDAKFVINDGQHRRAAIEQALRENPDLGAESIPIVLFHDRGLARSQQMFTDLNRYAIRPARSLTILYDQREDGARIVKNIIHGSPLWTDLVEMERGNLSARSRKLFTLSALHAATRALLEGANGLTVEDAGRLGRTYWDLVADKIPEWKQVHQRAVTSGEIRRDFIHSHGVVLHALGKVGNTILRDSHDIRKWKRTLGQLSTIDWSRGNSKLWEGRATIGGKVSKSGTNVTLTANVIRHALGISLSAEEMRVENLYKRG